MRIKDIPKTRSVPEDNKLAKEIFDYRKRYNMSQAEFGDKVDLDESYICKIENGDRKPTQKIVQKIYSVIYENDPSKIAPQNSDSDRNSQSGNLHLQMVLKLLQDMDVKLQKIEDQMLQKIEDQIKP